MPVMEIKHVSILIADWATLPECSNMLSDYVEMFYNCIPDS